MKDEKNIELTKDTDNGLTFETFKEQVINDFVLVCKSREASVLARKEVLTGKAKFGITGDGKEAAQIAMAKTFKNGDFRAGYYRDQTFMFATGMGNMQQFFAQLYADPALQNDPFSAGRQMNSHFATRSLDHNGEWKPLVDQKNSSADSSPTASQMARTVGLALASRVYRENPELEGEDTFSRNGNEVTFCTIGDSSVAEGVFFEALNAAGVLKIPLAISIWDDGYGISVPVDYQVTKGDVSEVLEGFRKDENGNGFDIYKIKGWDYASLCEAYEKGIEHVRRTHQPAIFHIEEVTQPQGHSTSGSHERYKSEERLQWERDYDCIVKMREWMIDNGIATEEECDKLENDAKKEARQIKNTAYKAVQDPIKEQIKKSSGLFDKLATQSSRKEDIEAVKKELNDAMGPARLHVMKAVKKALWVVWDEPSEGRNELVEWKNQLEQENKEYFNSHLFSQSSYNALNVEGIPAEYSDDSPVKPGYEVLNTAFDHILANNPRVLAFGEDVGHIGGVNQGFAGLQAKYGEHRVFDTGIREATIIGQGIGMAQRGLRPIAEIQYLDYLVYGLEPLTDDVACLQYRTKGGQKAPLIVRTRGHRLEGIWHTGSPLGMVINSLRGMHVLVPRNFTQAAGFYNTLLKSDEPGLIIEVLNAYRLKETVPDNIGEYTLPLGQPETLTEGQDVTIITYGACVNVANEAVERLEGVGISCELIDVQSLLPFDIDQRIVASLKKTNRAVFLDEDYPGGASAYMMEKVLEKQKGYYFLDSEPRTISAHPHRGAYGSDGDYFSKPNPEDVFEEVYKMMNEVEPEKWPMFF